MAWKQKLIAATGAFLSMPLAQAEEASSFVGVRRVPRVKLRVSSLPYIVDPETDQNDTVAVRMPALATERRRPSFAITSKSTRAWSIPKTAPCLKKGLNDRIIVPSVSFNDVSFILVANKAGHYNRRLVWNGLECASDLACR